MNLIVFLLFVLCDVIFCAIRNSAMMNKLKNVKPVGKADNFVPLTEIPPPQIPHLSGRRHLQDDCTEKPKWREVHEGGHVEIVGDYYEEIYARTMATVIMPDHIDYKHFEVTTQVPYLTVGAIEGIGFHYSIASPSECEKIYEDHLDEQYSADATDYSEESLEVAKMPVHEPGRAAESLEKALEAQYDE